LKLFFVRFGSEAETQHLHCQAAALRSEAVTQTRVLVFRIDRQLSCNHRSVRSSGNHHCHRQLAANSGH
jgi:hypothetical protein